MSSLVNKIVVTKDSTTCMFQKKTAHCNMSEPKSKPSKGSTKKKEGDADGKVLSDMFKLAKCPKFCEKGGLVVHC